MGEGRGKLGASVRDDFVVKAEAEKDFMEEKGGDSFSGDGFLGRGENHPLSKPMVYHDQERIKAGRDREICDEITGDLLEGTRCGGLDGRKWQYSGEHVGLVLLACDTPFYILADISGQVRPPEFGCHKLPGFEEARMSSGFMVIMMAVVEDEVVEGVIGRVVNTASVG